MNNIHNWVYSAAGKVSVALLVACVVIICLIFSNIGEGFISIETANTINNILIGVATTLFGIVVTVSFVQYIFNKQDANKKRENEIITIKRYDRYMETLIKKYLMFYIPVTTRLANRDKAVADNPFNHNFKFSDLADMYSTSMYVNESLVKPVIVLFYDAEEKLKEYMLRMLENVDFEYNPELEKILMEFVTKSTNLDVRGNILDAVNTRMGNTIASEHIASYIADEKNDWLEMFQQGKLKSNIMLPYVLFYYSIKGQVRLIKDYMDYMIKLND